MFEDDVKMCSKITIKSNITINDVLKYIALCKTPSNKHLSTKDTQIKFLIARNHF